LLGAVQAALAVVLWVCALAGVFEIPTALAPLDWHVHEMLYGYVAAVVAGFLLTAVPNWTGRLPIQGLPLLALVAFWLTGRVAVSSSDAIGWFAAMLIDLAFLAVFAAAVIREIFAGRNWGNLKVAGVLGLLIIGNLTFHLEAHFAGAADYGVRIGIAAAVGLVMLMGGRIVPSFTRNWLARANPGRLPAPFGRFDVASVAAGAAALVLWIVLPHAAATSVALIAAGLVQAVRLARWAGDRTWRDRLVLVLHVGYAFVPLGFLLLGAAGFRPDLVPSSAGIHAWTAGAVGLMTLAVMTRASLGHTGRALVATPAVQAIYAAAVLAAAFRVTAAIFPSVLLVEAAGIAWFAAFAGFALVYGPMLLRPRV
jgi:uncharacterized protein involved in response to NO